MPDDELPRGPRTYDQVPHLFTATPEGRCLLCGREETWENHVVVDTEAASG